LTTVQIPRERLGQLAFEILRSMPKKEVAAGGTTLDTELVIRDSPATAAPPDKLTQLPSNWRESRRAVKPPPECPQFAADWGMWQAGGS
jgi:hypothetical protein